MTKVSERQDVVSLLRGDALIKIRVRIWEPENSTKSLLCVHGFAGTSWDFTILARTLVRSGFTVIAPDIMGRGESTFTGEPKDYTLRNYVACVDAASRYQKDKKFHLGTSWGGIILLAYLASKNFVSDGIILNDIPIQSDSNLEHFREFLSKEAALLFDTSEGAREYVVSSRKIDYLVGRDREEFLASRVMQVGGNWRMRFDPAVVGSLDYRRPFSLVRFLERVEIPTLMAFGNESPYVNAPELKDLRDKNPKLTMITDLDDQHPPSLMKTSQILQITGYLAQCV